MNITEVVGMEGETIALQDIFVFEQRGADAQDRPVGRHGATGVVPKFISKMEAAGVYVPRTIFARS